MESYIVRIYRRDEDESHLMRGVIEEVGIDEQNSFGTKEELWNILSIAKKPGRRRKTPVSKGRKLNKKQKSTE